MRSTLFLTSSHKPTRALLPFSLRCCKRRCWRFRIKVNLQFLSAPCDKGTDGKKKNSPLYQETAFKISRYLASQNTPQGQVRLLATLTPSGITKSPKECFEGRNRIYRWAPFSLVAKVPMLCDRDLSRSRTLLGCTKRCMG